MDPMGSASVPVRRDTLERLRAYKRSGATYDEVLNDLMDTTPPPEFLREHRRRLRDERRTDWPTVKAKLGL